MKEAIPYQNNTEKPKLRTGPKRKYACAICGKKTTKEESTSTGAYKQHICSRGCGYLYVHYVVFAPYKPRNHKKRTKMFLDSKGMALAKKKGIDTVLTEYIPSKKKR